MKGFKLSIVTLSVLLLGIIGFAFTADGAQLDGKKYNIKANGNGEKDAPDQLAFDSGAFQSTECNQYGFGSAPYQVKKMGDGWHFTATTLSKKEGKIEWTGHVHGDGKIEGSYKWTKGTRTLEYSFTGAEVK